MMYSTRVRRSGLALLAASTVAFSGLMFGGSANAATLSGGTPDSTAPGGGGSCSVSATATSPDIPVNEGDVNVKTNTCGYSFRARIVCNDNDTEYSASRTSVGTSKAYCNNNTDPYNYVIEYSYQEKIAGGSWVTHDVHSKG